MIKMKPQKHIVIATRVDPTIPPARLRAGNQLSELRTLDLSKKTQ
jgi:hypothetical protein